MDLNTYFIYACVTALIALMVIIISLAIKSWFDEQTFTSNLLLARQFNKMDQDQMMKNLSSLDWDMHVESTPGMTNLN
jgi:hypothetical protein